MELTSTDDSTSALIVTLEIDRIDRWNVFARLRHLSIICCCHSGQPLRVKAETPTAVAQVWSVVQQVTSSRETLVDHLERCWIQQVHGDANA